MKFGVTSKLFLAFLLTNVAIALVVAIAAQIAVKTGFRSYVNEREERRLSTLSDALIDAYRAHGDWAFLRGNDALWRSFNRPGPLGPERFGPDSLRPRPRMEPTGRRRRASGPDRHREKGRLVPVRFLQRPRCSTQNGTSLPARMCRPTRRRFVRSSSTV